MCYELKQNEAKVNQSPMDQNEAPVHKTIAPGAANKMERIKKNQTKQGVHCANKLDTRARKRNLFHFRHAIESPRMKNPNGDPSDKAAVVIFRAHAFFFFNFLHPLFF